MAVRLSWTIRDYRNKRSTVNLWVQDGETLATYSAALTEFGALIDAASLGVIESMRFEVSPDPDPGWSTVPSPTNPNLIGCNFLYDTSGEHGFTLRLPAISASLVNGDLVTVTGNAPMEAVRDAILNGFQANAVTIVPEDPNGATIDAFLASKFSRAGK